MYYCVLNILYDMYILDNRYLHTAYRKQYAHRGSAAFNLLCIIAVCISAIPPGEAGGDRRYTDGTGTDGVMVFQDDHEICRDLLQ